VGVRSKSTGGECGKVRVRIRSGGGGGILASLAGLGSRGGEGVDWVGGRGGWGCISTGRVWNARRKW